MELAGSLVKIDGREVKIPALGELSELARINVWYLMFAVVQEIGQSRSLFHWLDVGGWLGLKISQKNQPFWMTSVVLSAKIQGDQTVGQAVMGSIAGQRCFLYMEVY